MFTLSEHEKYSYIKLYIHYKDTMSLFPLNYTLYLIFRELATVGDIYRGQHEFHTQPWLSITYTIHPT